LWRPSDTFYAVSVILTSCVYVCSISILFVPLLVVVVYVHQPVSPCIDALITRRLYERGALKSDVIARERVLAAQSLDITIQCSVIAVDPQ